jgi:hypothetical protein
MLHCVTHGGILIATVLIEKEKYENNWNYREAEP